MSIYVSTKDDPVMWIEVYWFMVHPYLILKCVCYIFQFVLYWFYTLDNRSCFWDLHIYVFIHSSCFSLKRRHTLREKILKCMILIRRKWVTNICNIYIILQHYGTVVCIISTAWKHKLFLMQLLSIYKDCVCTIPLLIEK